MVWVCEKFEAHQGTAEIKSCGHKLSWFGHLKTYGHTHTIRTGSGNGNIWSSTKFNVHAYNIDWKQEIFSELPLKF